MGRANLARVAVAAALSLAFLGCSKSATGTSNPYTVEYLITPASMYFTLITYTDQNGQSVSVGDLSTFSSGAKSLSVSTKPFDAKISTVMNNTSVNAVAYTLTILVDGQVKTVTNGSAPPGDASYTTSAEFVVQ